MTIRAGLPDCWTDRNEMGIAKRQLSKTFKDFFDSEKLSGILLIICTLVSLLITNSVIALRSRNPITSFQGPAAMSDKDLYSGMIRLHILYHASKGPIFGLSIIEELGRHGYKLSPGTLYPILHGLESKGYLRSTEKRDGRRTRRFYRATPAGRKALKSAKERVRELVGELFEEE